MERMLKYEHKFLRIHTLVVISILAYTAFLFFYHPNALKWSFIISLGFLHSVNYFLYKIRFFNQPYTLYGIKLIQIYSVVYVMFYSYLAIAVLGVVLFIVLFIELLIISSQHAKFHKNILTFICIVLVTVTGIFSLRSLFINDFIHGIFFIVITTILLFGLSLIISENVSELMEQIETQKDLLAEAKQTNEMLRITQQKYKNAHDQLAKQNLDLEEAYAKLNRASSETYIQNELLRYISASLEIDHLMEMVTDSIIGAIGVDTCSIIIYDEAKGTYQIKTKSIYSKDYTAQLKESLEKGQLNAYFNCSRVYTDNLVHKQAYPFLGDRQVKSIMITPLTRQSVTYGLLIAEHKAPNTFKDNIQFFNGIANQINIAINNANLYARMEEMAIRDGLTGVYNRSYLQKRFKEIMKESVEHHANLSVLLFDIDKFKQVNDTYGHLFGDEAIKMVAKITERLATIHKGLFGRYGGEEFVMILPNQGVQEALEVGKKILSAIKNEPLYYTKDEKIYINVSIGITSYPEICKKPEDLLNRADIAMYYSKENGRGRITLDNGDLELKCNL